MPRSAVRIAAIVAVAAFCRPATPAALADEAPFRDVRVESVRLSEVDSEGARLGISVRATANVTATLEYLVFDRMTIGSLAVNLPPVNGPIRLREGEPVSGLPVLEARISYRELDSLEPLRRIIGDQRARVTGVLRGRLSLGFLQRLSLMARQAWVVTAIDQDVPVVFPGGMFARMAGLTALTVAEPLWVIARGMQRDTDAAAIEEARAAMAGSIVSLETRYAMRHRDGQVIGHDRTAIGFLVADGMVLTTAEAVEPWFFDPVVAEALERRDVTVVESSVEVARVSGATEAPPANGNAWQRTPLRIWKTLHRRESVISPSTRRRFHMRFRGVDENAVLLTADALPGASLQLADVAPASEWRPATVARVRRTGETGVPELVRTAVRWSEGRYQLRDPMDADTFGSPIWTTAGAIGLVQDESSGAGLRVVLEKLGVRR